ncbi:MAG: hypothetical protein VB056_10760 [Sphaerochaeta associata]|uniref:hypothetical protein n=1 Tax=Sphaerochaeta associata TaxID=1129264 RepID=UPI002B21E79F|nr:hypothetical protein [Sphaerochaeta associata]MEA5029350.1 hypothetical protein [Sphaerochaeta associata]
MSESARYDARLEAERRRQAWLDQVRSTTSGFLSRFQDSVQRVVDLDLGKFIPDELNRIQEQLSEIEALLDDDPEGAREISFEVGGKISGLRSLAESAKRRFEAEERARKKELQGLREKATNSIQQFFMNQISKIEDPVELEFAYEEIAPLQERYMKMTIEPGKLETEKENILSSFASILPRARARTETWRNEQKATLEKAANRELILMYKRQLAEELERLPEARDEAIRELETLEHRLDTIDKQETIANQVKEIAEKAMLSLHDEQCRRMVVSSVFTALKSVGFTVANPKLDAQSGQVVIQARKPAGVEASFSVSLDGTLVYKFDHYEGMKCKSDIDSILPLLTDIYGVELSEERILWQNPERISSTAKPIQSGYKERSNG